MKPVEKLDLPVLKDVVVPGKDIPITDDIPQILSELQTKALQQQIDQIIQARLEVALKKATQQVVKDLKTHLEKVLPELIKAAYKKNG